MIDDRERIYQIFLQAFFTNSSPTTYLNPQDISPLCIIISLYTKYKIFVQKYLKRGAVFISLFKAPPKKQEAYILFEKEKILRWKEYTQSNHANKLLVIFLPPAPFSGDWGLSGLAPAEDAGGDWLLSGAGLESLALLELDALRLVLG